MGPFTSIGFGGFLLCGQSLEDQMKQWVLPFWAGETSKLDSSCKLKDGTGGSHDMQGQTVKDSDPRKVGPSRV